MRILFKWVGLAFGLLLVLRMALGLLVNAGVVPSDRVVTGTSLQSRHHQVLLDEGIVARHETIELFYSEALLSVRGGGSVLTDRRVIAYQENDDDEVDVWQIDNEDIGAVVQTQQGTALEFAVYQVVTKDEETWLELYLPHELGDAERFAHAVRQKIN